MLWRMLKKDWVTYVALAYLGAVVVCCFMAPSGTPNTIWLPAVLLLTLPWSIGYGALLAWAIAHDGVGIIILPALISAVLNIALTLWLLASLSSKREN